MSLLLLENTDKLEVQKKKNLKNTKEAVAEFEKRISIEVRK